MGRGTKTASKTENKMPVYEASDGREVIRELAIQARLLLNKDVDPESVDALYTWLETMNSVASSTELMQVFKLIDETGQSQVAPTPEGIESALAVLKTNLPDLSALSKKATAAIATLSALGDVVTAATTIAQSKRDKMLLAREKTDIARYIGDLMPAEALFTQGGSIPLDLPVKCIPLCAKKGTPYRLVASSRSRTQYTYDNYGYSRRVIRKKDVEVVFETFQEALAAYEKQKTSVSGQRFDAKSGGIAALKTLFIPRALLARRIVEHLKVQHG